MVGTKTKEGGGGRACVLAALATGAHTLTPTDTPTREVAELGGVRRQRRQPRKHPPPKAPSVPQSPATATRAFCLADLQLPGYGSSTP